MPATQSRGQSAKSPTDIPREGWWDILRRVKDEIAADHVSVVAAGVAFFGLLAMFPAITALISIAGYVVDPEDVGSRLASLASALPPEAATIIQDQVNKVTGGDRAASGIFAVVGLGLALYGATRGTMTLIEGMNIAYDEKEKRGLVALYGTGIALTVALIVGFLVVFAAIVVLPAAVAILGLPTELKALIPWLQWPLLAFLTLFGLAIIYRFGPSRAQPRWRWVSPGALIATVLWLLGTVAFSVYAQNFSNYTETYGTLGGIIMLLTWLWLSAFIVLLGAELNAETEHQSLLDTTTGPALPMGRRGAAKADTLPEGPAFADEPGQGLLRRRPLTGHGDHRQALRPTSTRQLAGLMALLVAWYLLPPRKG